MHWTTTNHKNLLSIDLTCNNKLKEKERKKTINFLILVKYNHHHHFFRLSRWWINLIRIKTTTTTTKSFFLLWPIMKKEKNLWYNIDIDICCLALVCSGKIRNQKKSFFLSLLFIRWFAMISSLILWIWKKGHKVQIDQFDANRKKNSK